MTNITPRLITAEQVAARLGHSPIWFMRNKKRLIEQEKFPEPVRGISTRWDYQAVDAWLDRQLPSMQTIDATHQNISVEDILISRARTV